MMGHYHTPSHKKDDPGMLQLAFSEADKQALHYERYHHPHPRRVLKVGGAEPAEDFSNYAMTGKQLPCLGITGDRRVAHVHHGVLDVGMP